MTSQAGSFAFEIETDSVVGPRVLYTMPPADPIQRGLWSEEIEEAAAVVGYEVDWHSQVAVDSSRFAAPLVAAPATMYQIEGRDSHGVWDVRHAGELITFASRAEAEAAILRLAQIHESPESDYRVVEVVS